MVDDDDLPPEFISFFPENVLLEIGKISVTFSFLEDELNGYIGVLLGSGTQASQAVTFRIRNITDRIQLAQTLVDIKIKFDDDRRREATSLLRDLAEANDRRNTLIHHGIIQVTYNVDPKEHTIKFRKKDYLIRETPIETSFKAREFEELREDLWELARRFMIATHAHRVSSAPQPAQHPQP
ncbi:MAG: hypothetical protein WB760_13310 [Xanthobacteraceae bacterium]